MQTFKQIIEWRGRPLWSFPAKMGWRTSARQSGAGLCGGAYGWNTSRLVSPSGNIPRLLVTEEVSRSDMEHE